MNEVLNEIGRELGLGVAANAIFEAVKAAGLRHITKQEAAAEVENVMRVYGVTISAERVINALAQRGFLTIENSRLSAGHAWTFGSKLGGSAVFGGNTSIMTRGGTGIVATGDAYIRTTGDAQIIASDGIVDLNVGKK